MKIKKTKTDIIDDIAECLQYTTPVTRKGRRSLMRMRKSKLIQMFKRICE